jgi:hypothetical protein
LRSAQTRARLSLMGPQEFVPLCPLPGITHGLNLKARWLEVEPSAQKYGERVLRTSQPAIGRRALAPGFEPSEERRLEFTV